MKKGVGHVVVFGTFDSLHDGHLFFLKEAKKLGNRLTVVLAPDSVALRLKGKLPRRAFEERADTLMRSGIPNKVVSAESTINSWSILSVLQPDCIAIGYDQKELLSSLTFYLVKSKSSIKTVLLPPFKDGSLHSSSNT